MNAPPDLAHAAHEIKRRNYQSQLDGFATAINQVIARARAEQLVVRASVAPDGFDDRGELTKLILSVERA